MKQSITTLKRNVIIFVILSTLCGWNGYVVDKVTGARLITKISEQR